MMKRHFFTLVLCLGLGACAGGGPTADRIGITPVGLDEQLPATLVKPAGPGPFPAVVILHDCSGLGPRSSGAPGRWAEELVAKGYVAIMPDSFSTRGFADGVCTVADTIRQRVGASVRARDAYGALAYLRSLPFVDPHRIGVMGGSHGGASTLATMVAAKDGPLAAAKSDGFAAGIALYPGCGGRYGDWSVQRRDGASGPIVGYAGIYRPIAPLLILVGEKDDWTPAEPCRRLRDAAHDAGLPVDIVVYPGAHHSFDSYAPVRYVAERTNASAPSGHGATTGGDPDAWADAKRQVSTFFAARLGGRAE